MKTYDDIGVGVPEIYLPKEGIDLQKWAVIACDQFTSEPDYWRQVRDFVGGSPSTLHLIMPEIDLEAPDKTARINKIQRSMHQYLHQGMLQPHEGMIYVERSVGGKMRRGLLLCLDLERYDFSRGSKSLIRATEGTIIERLPPRMAIREGAPLELPHILVLIDDPGQTVIEPLEGAIRGSRPAYDFDLMLGSGHLSGYTLGAGAQDQAVSALRKLAKPEAFQARYGLDVSAPVLLFAMGDGNHSLATAKAVWEKMKPQVGLGHPARYALVEIENVHDGGLEFEPIHRLLFGVTADVLVAVKSALQTGVTFVECDSREAMENRVDRATEQVQLIGLVRGNAQPRYGVLEVHHPTSTLAVGTLQAFLDDFMSKEGAGRIDYVHGGDVVDRLGSQSGNVGFYLPRMGKSSLFKTVILDSVLPRKTFSMGEAREKRFYMEARRIS